MLNKRLNISSGGVIAIVLGSVLTTLGAVVMMALALGQLESQTDQLAGNDILEEVKFASVSTRILDENTELPVLENTKPFISAGRKWQTTFSDFMLDIEDNWEISESGSVESGYQAIISSSLAPDTKLTFWQPAAKPKPTGFSQRDKDNTDCYNFRYGQISTPAGKFIYTSEFNGEIVRLSPGSAEQVLTTFCQVTGENSSTQESEFGFIGIVTAKQGSLNSQQELIKMISSIRSLRKV